MLPKKVKHIEYFGNKESFH
jgi:hypothetical protein